MQGALCQRRAHVFTICDAAFSFSFHGNLGVKDDHWANGYPLEFLSTRGMSAVKNEVGTPTRALRCVVTA